MGGIAGIVKANSYWDSCLIDNMAEVFKTHSQLINVHHSPLADVLMGHSQPDRFLDGELLIMVHGFISTLNLPPPSGGWEGMGCAELVAQAYKSCGECFAPVLNGSFIVMLWDQKIDRIVLACDRYGSKPLYYCTLNNSLFFSTEQKAFWACPGFRKELDRDALMEYFTFQNIFSDRTFYQSVNRFPAGSYVVLNPHEPVGTPRFHAFFDYQFQAISSTTRDYNECVDELSCLFSQAVRRQLSPPGTDRVGAYLSGGVDSGLTVAIAAQHRQHLYTFTCGFDLTSTTEAEVHLDERSIAESISAQYQTEHYEMVLKSSDMERVMRPFSLAMEEPRLGQAYPNYCIANLASRFTPIVLSGNGGDELFGGYPWRYYRALDCCDFEEYIDRYYSYWQRLIPTNLTQKIFAPLAAPSEQTDTREIFKNVFSQRLTSIQSPQECINHSMYFEAKTFMRGLSILDEKISTANGIEQRTPFIDNDLVDFAMKLPVEFKLHNLLETIRLNENDSGNKSRAYFLKTNDGKRILRSLMRRHLPESITRREKQGFSAPDASWFRGESALFVRKLLAGSDVRLYDYLDRNIVTELVDEHLSGRENRRLLLWSLLCFENWCQLFL